MISIIICAGDAGIFKTCTQCDEVKPLRYFGARSERSGNAKSKCKVCLSLYADAYRTAHRTPIRKKATFTSFACESCGETTERTSSSQRYCEVCRPLVKIEYDRGRHGKDVISTPVRCAWCDDDFVRHAGGKKYCCEDCTVAARKDRQKVSARRRRLDPVENSKMQARRKGRKRNNKTRRDYEKRRTAEDPQYAIHRRMKAMVNNFLAGKKNGRSWVDLVGYTSDELCKHLERQFVIGMTWDNRDKWHIDHILPQSSFAFSTAEDDEFKACWALTNLRPLWSEKNQSKGNKRIYLI